MSSSSNLHVTQDPGLSNVKSGTVYIRSSKVPDEWYSISEKHVERIIYGSKGFQIMFHHPLPPDFSRISDNFEIQSNDRNTILWIDKPKKNFRCYQCKLLCETETETEAEFINDSEPGVLISKIPETKDVPIESKCSSSVNTFQLPTLWKSPNLSEYKIESPTVMVGILSLLLLFDWLTPLVGIFIIWLGLSYTGDHMSPKKCQKVSINEEINQEFPDWKILKENLPT